MTTTHLVSVPVHDRMDYVECPTSDQDVYNERNETKISKKSSTHYVKDTSLSFMPIFDCYNWKENLQGDIVAGLTVGIMHVPQGMAHAVLAHVPPISGLYSSFFASTLYMLFGTSRHISIGSMAVVSMMIGAAQMEYISHDHTEITNETNVTGPLGDVTPLELTSALTLAVGIVQFIMALSRLGFITAYLSDPLVSGFTTGAAFQGLLSQVNKLFGVKLPRYSGTGMAILMIRDIVLDLPNTNQITLLFSLCGMIFLWVGKDFLVPYVKKYTSIPIPLELILVIITIIISVTFNVNEDYGVKIVDTIPKGFPSPSTPQLHLIFDLIFDAIPIAVVCYILIVSMGKVFAKKHKYRIDAAQEMYACSFFSSLSSIFPVFPAGTSLSRSVIGEMAGAKTQLFNLFSSCLLLTVILYLGPLLEPLPVSILACIIIVNLKSLLMQVNQLPRLYKISKYDFAIWIVVCSATILCTVAQGLVIGLSFTILTIVLREQWPRFSVLSQNNIDSISRNVYKHAKVLKFNSPLHFANVTTFTDTITTAMRDMDGMKKLIIDCSAMHYVDSMGVDAIREAYHDVEELGISIYFVGLQESTIDMFKRISFFEEVPYSIFQSPNIK